MHKGALSSYDDLQEMLGDVLALSEPEASLEAYRRGISLLQEATDQSGPSARLLNNAAVMEYRKGHADEACSLIERATARLADGASAILVTSIFIVTYIIC
jgi:hypothetical protein